jgi:flagellar hook-associated protein FlgK
VGLSYQWKLGVNPISGATNINYNTNQAGSYSVMVTDGNGCSQTSAAQVLTVNPTPVATITYGTPLVFCEGGAVVLSTTAGSNLAYQWMLNSTPIANAVNSTNISYQTGAYTVKVTTNLNCSATSQPVNVTVNPLPHPVITKNQYTLSTAGGFASYQWFFNGQPIGGATGPVFTASQNGAYYVTVTDNNGCTNTSPVMYVNNVGVGIAGVTVHAADVKLYPNPAHALVYVDAPVPVNIAIHDLAGRTVLQQQKAKEINISSLADGVYMILIADEQGHMIKTEKLFKAE